MDDIIVSADKIEALREDVSEFRQDMRAMNQALQQLIVNQSENRFTKEHVERVEMAVTTGVDRLTQTIANQQVQLNEINRTVFLHSKIWTGITIALGLLFAPTLGLLGWNNSQMEALKDRQVSQNVRLTLIEQKLEIDPRERDVNSSSRN